MKDLPEIYDDLQGTLTDQGFKVPDNGVWYHGTSSALLDSIKRDGLNRSGDRDLNQAAKKTMATIGNNYTEKREPIFLTQSKALAHFWAKQCVHRRSVRFAGSERPVVLELRLADVQAAQVRPDVGAAGLSMTKEGESFMVYVAKCYEHVGAGALDIDLMKAGRDEYLQKIGMAYIDQDLPARVISDVI